MGAFYWGALRYPTPGYDKSQNSLGNEDYWVVKIDANGNKVWDKTLGGNKDDRLTSMMTTTDGGFLLGGSSLSDAGYDKSQNSLGGYDYWVVKIDANGNKVWDKTLGGAGLDQLSSVVATSDGGFLLGGYSNSSAGSDKAENSRGGYDYWVVKIDANGNKGWDKTLGGANNDELSSMVATADGNFLLGGYSTSNAGGDKSQNSRGDTDYWIVRLLDCQQFTASLSASGVISCANPTVTLTATPSPGATYAFSQGATQLGGGNTATVTQPGTYSVSVTSAYGCAASAALSVDGTVPTIGSIRFVKPGATGSGASWDCATAICRRHQLRCPRPAGLGGRRNLPARRGSVFLHERRRQNLRRLCPQRQPHQRGRPQLAPVRNDAPGQRHQCDAQPAEQFDQCRPAGRLHPHRGLGP